MHSGIDHRADVTALEHLQREAGAGGQADGERLPIVGDRRGGQQQGAFGGRLLERAVDNLLPGALQRSGRHGGGGRRGGGLRGHRRLRHWLLHECGLRCHRRLGRPSPPVASSALASCATRVSKGSRGCRSGSCRRRHLRSRSARDTGRGCRPSDRRRRERTSFQLLLEDGEAIGERLDREVRLRPRDPREGDLQNEPLVGGGAHLARGVAEHGERAGHAVGGAERGRLGAQGVEGLPRRAHRARSVRRDRYNVDVTHMPGKLAGELQQVAARSHELLDLGKERRHVPLGERRRRGAQNGPGNLAEEVLRSLDADVAVAKNAELLQGGQRVAHAAARVAHDELERGVVEGEALAAAHIGEVRLHLVRRDRVEVEALHAREDRGQDLLGVGRAHDEDDVLGRLLERLEQRVERRRREHVDLVDDVDLAAAHRRGVVNAADDLVADVVHAGARRGVELGHVGVLARGDEPALLAGAVGQALALLAHEGLGKQARHGGLARAARSAKEVRMARLVLRNSAHERLDHVFLADDLLERLWAVLCIERFHAASAASR